MKLINENINTEIEGKAIEAVNPVYADAVRQTKINDEKREEAVKIGEDPVEQTKENIKTPELKKMYLSESLFEDQSIDETSNVINISDIIFYDADEELDIATENDLDRYYKLMTNQHDVETFNYHSDYWGYADEYQEENLKLWNKLEPFVNREVQIDYDDGSIRGTLLGIAVDRQYNDVEHTKIVLDHINEIPNNIEEKISEPVSEFSKLEDLLDNAGYVLFAPINGVARLAQKVKVDKPEMKYDYTKAIKILDDKDIEFDYIEGPEYKRPFIKVYLKEETLLTEATEKSDSIYDKLMDALETL